MVCMRSTYAVHCNRMEGLYRSGTESLRDLSGGMKCELL